MVIVIMDTKLLDYNSLFTVNKLGVVDKLLLQDKVGIRVVQKWQFFVNVNTIKNVNAGG